MNANQILGVALIATALFLLFGGTPGIVPPSTPVNQALVADIKSVMTGDAADQDAENLGRCMLACANLFAVDSQRPEPYYKDPESMKWAIKNVGDLSYPLGWKMSEKYPALPAKLGGWLQSQVGENVEGSRVVEKLRELGYALIAI